MSFLISLICINIIKKNNSLIIVLIRKIVMKENSFKRRLY